MIHSFTRQRGTKSHGTSFSRFDVAVLDAIQGNFRRMESLKQSLPQTSQLYLRLLCSSRFHYHIERWRLLGARCVRDSRTLIRYNLYDTTGEAHQNSSNTSG